MALSIESHVWTLNFVRLIAALAIMATGGVAHSQNASSITNPRNGQVDVDLGDTVRWTAAPGALAYYLYVGSAPGAKDFVDTGEIQQFSYPMATLPPGRQVYARLYTKFATSWRFMDVSFSIAPVARFISPSRDDAVLDIKADRISWTPVYGAQAYYLYVGTQPGAKNLIDSGEVQQTSLSITTLPVGQRVYARVYTKISAGRWTYADRAFSTRPVAYFTKPVNNAAEIDVRADNIAWTSVPGAEAYYLYVGTELGKRDLIDTGETQLRSVSASTLPIGRTLYARVHTLYGGRWHAVDATFKTRPVAYFVNPASAAVELDVRSERISWTSVADVQAYYLYVGTFPGGKDLINTGETTKTSVSASALPVAQLVYARLYTKVGDKWRYIDSSFVTRPVAYIANIAAGARAVDPSVPMSWFAVPGANAYVVDIGSAPGGRDLFHSGETPRTESRIDMLPGGRTVYVTLHTLWGGRWRSISSSFTVSSTARLSGPPGGFDGLDPNIGILQWNTVNAAEAYRMTIGTASGQSDIFDSGLTSGTAARVPSLPGGEELYVRLWTRVTGEWTYADVVVTTLRVAGFISPMLGARGVAAPAIFRWTSVAGASGYRLRIGTEQGGSNLFDSGVVSDNSAAVMSLGDPATLYARISTLFGNGSWTHSDIVFSTEPQPAQPPRMLMPSESDEMLDVSYGIEWQRDPMVRHYDLVIGSTPGGNEVSAVTRISANRRLIGGLESGTRYYGRLTAEMLDGSRLTRDFSFFADDGVITAEAAADIAMWATASLRGQASFDNVPMPGSLLRRIVSSAGKDDTATCYNFSRALLEYLVEAGVTVPARQRDICLQNNAFDCHTVVEIADESSGSWQILDPTFALTVRRAGYGHPLSAHELSDLIWSGDWQVPEYEFLSAAGDAYVRDYYLDYPILFALRIDENGRVENQRSVISLYDFVGSSVDASVSTYALMCEEGEGTVTALIDGSEMMLACDSPDRLTRAFTAETVAPVAGNTAELAIYSPRRRHFAH